MLVRVRLQGDVLSQLKREQSKEEGDAMELPAMSLSSRTPSVAVDAEAGVPAVRAERVSGDDESETYNALRE
jgi:hypothetical protein